MAHRVVYVLWGSAYTAAALSRCGLPAPIEGTCGNHTNAVLFTELGIAL